MKHALSRSEINHLRRLLAWMRCEIGQSPDELMAMVKTIAPAIVDSDGEPSQFGKHALVDMYRKSRATPKYIRAAIKSLEKLVREADGNIVDAEVVATRCTRKLGRDKLRIR